MRRTTLQSASGVHNLDRLPVHIYFVRLVTVLTMTKLTMPFVDVDKNNLVRQRVINNLTYTWSDGPFNDLNVKAFDSPSVGLRAAFYSGPIYGVDLTGTDLYTGVRVWVATSSSTFVQYSWRAGMPQWNEDRTWEGMNGVATPASFGWFTQTFYVLFMDETATARLYW